MNYKILLIGILIICSSSCKTVAQIKSDSPIENSTFSFNSLTNKSAKYKLDFIEEKTTLYFKCELGEKKKFGYKAILADIHPEGIFIIEKKNTMFLRILSTDNRKVFVREIFRGQFRNSNNTNIIDIELPENSATKELEELVENLKSIFIKKEKEPQIQIVEPPRTKND